MTSVRLEDVWVPTERDEPAVFPVWNGKEELVGHIWLHPGSSQTLYISWYIDEEHRGQGHATRAAGQVIPHLFRHCHRVLAVTSPENGPSRTVALRLGFRLESVAKQARWNLRDQVWEDILIWAMLEEDWNRRQSWVGKSH